MPIPQTPLSCTTWPSPVGDLLLVASTSHLWGVWFADQHGVPDWARSASKVDVSQHPVLQKTTEQLAAYFEGERRDFDLPLDFSWGTAFQQAVWHTLSDIAYGRTTSYRDVARAIQRPQAVRAVGGAVGRNPLGIVLPCHRVVGTQGQLTGYTGGLQRKVALLALEAQHCTTGHAA